MYVFPSKKETVFHNHTKQRTNATMVMLNRLGLPLAMTLAPALWSRRNFWFPNLSITANTLTGSAIVRVGRAATSNVHCAICSQLPRLDDKSQQPSIHSPLWGATSERIYCKPRLRNGPAETSETNNRSIAPIITFSSFFSFFLPSFLPRSAEALLSCPMKSIRWVSSYC